MGDEQAVRYSWRCWWLILEKPPIAMDDMFVEFWPQNSVVQFWQESGEVRGVIAKGALR
jgi:hypothetical protein